MLKSLSTSRPSILPSVALALVSMAVVAGFVAGQFTVPAAHAQGRQTASEVVGGVIPKAWGAFKGHDSGFLCFEAADGTIRLFPLGHAMESKGAVKVTRE